VSVSCPFCNPDPDRVFLVRPRLLGIWDAFPVTPGHALIIPARHVADLASASAEERQGLWDLVDPVMKVVAKHHGPVDGFNIGINGGEAAGQTVPHLHIHVIPRRHGDVADPRGGVRYVIPAKANYLAAKTTALPGIAVDSSSSDREPLLELVTGPGVQPITPEQPLVFDNEARRTGERGSDGQAGARSEPGAADQVRFLTRLECLLEGGSFAATYKYALLLALSDLAVEQGGDDVSEVVLSTDTIAEKFIEYYWEQAGLLAGPRRAAAPTASTSANAPRVAEAPPSAPAVPHGGKIKAEKVVALLAAVYGDVGGMLPALRADEARWTKLLKAVRTVVQSTPLWKLQTVGDAEIDFLYPNLGRGSQIALRPGVAFCLRRFHGVIGHLVRGAWGGLVRSQSGELLPGVAETEEVLFGSRRERLRDVVPVLHELQNGLCFYTGKEISRAEHAEVDHFVPFSRYAHDLGHNLVVVSKRAKIDKAEHLAAEDHLAKWCEQNAKVGKTLADACAAVGIASDQARSLAVARWAYAQADRAEMPVWGQGTTLEQRLSGRWREILGSRVGP